MDYFKNKVNKESINTNNLRNEYEVAPSVITQTKIQLKFKVKPLFSNLSLIVLIIHYILLKYVRVTLFR